MSKQDTIGSGDEMSEDDTDVSEEDTDRDKKKIKRYQPSIQSEVIDYVTYFNDPDDFLKRQRDISMQQLDEYRVRFSEDSGRFEQLIEGCIDDISRLMMKHKKKCRALEQQFDSLDKSSLPHVAEHAVKYHYANLGMIEEMKIFKDGWDVLYRLRGGAYLQPGSGIDSMGTTTSPSDNGAGSGGLDPEQEATSVSAPENLTLDEAGIVLQGKLIRVERQKCKKTLEDHRQMLIRFVGKLSGMSYIHKDRVREYENWYASLGTDDDPEPVRVLLEKYEVAWKCLWKETRAIWPVCTKIREQK